MTWTGRGRRGKGHGQAAETKKGTEPTSLGDMAAGPSDAEPPVGLGDMAAGPIPDENEPANTLHVPLDMLDSPNFDKAKNIGRIKRRWSRRLSGVARDSHETMRDVPTLPTSLEPAMCDDETVLNLAHLYDKDYLKQYEPYYEEARRRGLMP